MLRELFKSRKSRINRWPDLQRFSTIQETRRNILKIFARNRHGSDAIANRHWLTTTEVLRKAGAHNVA